MDEKDLLKSLVGKTLNMPDDEIASIYTEDGKLKDDALDLLVNKDADRIKALKDAHKDELTKVHDKGYKKAQAESLSNFEKELREEFQITDSTAKGKELVKEILSKMAKDTHLTEEQVKLHPKFLELERKLTGEYVPKTDYEKVVGDFDLYKKTFEQRQVLQTITQDAVKIFRSLKPVLSKDPAKATNQENKFMQEFAAYEYEVQADGNHIIKVDGKRLETANGHPVTFADFVKGRAAELYDFEVQDDKGGTGNKGGAGGGSVTVPKTEREYLVAIAGESDPAKRVAIKKAWDERNK